MKKFTLILAAMLAVAFAAPAFAADNLELSGTYRLQGLDKKDVGFVDDADDSYFRQRVRIQGKIKASDNAYVVLRTDITEGTWGSDFTDQDPAGADPGHSWYRANPDTNSNIHFDRAFGVYENDNFQVTMGLQYYGLGIMEVVDGQYTAAKLRLKFGAVEPSFFFGKMEENGDTDDDGVFDDTNMYAVNLSFDLAGFDSNAFFAMVDDNSVDREAWVGGFHAAGKAGMFDLTGEFAFFGGEKSATVDYEGIQFYAEAKTDLSEMVNVGGRIFWAAGYEDADEAQLANLSNADTVNVADWNAPCANDVVVTGNGPFDFTGDGAGVIGGSLYGSYKVMEQLAFGAVIAYLTPEEDDATNMDSLASYSLWAAYDLGSNTSFMVLYNIADPDFEGDTDDEDQNTLYARFQIAF